MRGKEQRRKKKTGFTLIELAVVMTIMGILIASFLQFYEIQLEKSRIETTRKRLDDLRTDLTIYVAAYNKLPCPASVAPPSGKADDEQPASACTEGKEEDRGEIDTHKTDGSDLIITGVIPIRDLRLTQEQATDGWGNLFTYVVAKKLTREDGMRGNPPPPGSLDIIDAVGRNILDTPGTGRYVIISHGRTGKGAWTAGGTRRPCDREARDGVNCSGGATFVEAPFSLRPGQNYYDDIVIHDDVNVRGTLLDRIVVCNAKRAFYEPGDNSADSDGCVKEPGLWEGACLRSFTLDPSGTETPYKSANVVMAPATANGAECGCDSAHHVQKIGAWDDGTVQVTVAPPKGAPPGTSPTTQAQLKRTALYVCVN